MASLVGKSKSFEKMLLANEEASKIGLTPFLRRFDVPKTKQVKDPETGKVTNEIVEINGKQVMEGNPSNSVTKDGIQYLKITDDNMGALKGFFVKPEVKAALEGQAQSIAQSLPGFLSPMYSAFLGAKGASALAKTVFLLSLKFVMQLVVSFYSYEWKPRKIWRLWICICCCYGAYKIKDDHCSTKRNVRRSFRFKCY